MSTSLPPASPPPSARDFFVYERVVIELASTRQVAAEANISQTRVRQIIGKVLDWLAESLSAKANLTDEAQLRVARHIAADRLEDLYRSANKKWLATEECKYGNLAIRVIVAKSKLPAVAGHYAALMATALTGPLLDDAPTTQPPTTKLTPPTFDLPASPPPPGDCSPAPTAPPKPATKKGEASAPTPIAEQPSDHLPPTARAARRAFLHTAHTPTRSVSEGLEPTSPAEAITELKLSPDTLGASLQRPLTRQQRRRLRRAQSTR